MSSDQICFQASPGSGPLANAFLWKDGVVTYRATWLQKKDKL